MNNNKGPLLTLWKKNKFKIIDKKNIKYNEQRGDLMNIICPRQYQLLNLSIINSDKSFWVINTYLNNFSRTRKSEESSDPRLFNLIGGACFYVQDIM